MFGSQGPTGTFVFVCSGNMGRKSTSFEMGDPRGTNLKSHLNAVRLEAIGARGEQGGVEPPALRIS